MKGDSHGGGPVVTLFGDSIVAAYGLSPGEALPIELRSAPAELGVPAQIIVAGADGDTTSGSSARSRVSAPA